VTAASILPMPVPDLKRLWPLGLVILALLALPLIADRFTVVLATDIIIFALFAASLGLIMGAGGMASFGHAAYFGAGAYAAAVAAKAGAPFLVAVPAGVTFAGALAVLFGWFCVRLTGVSLAMLTLAFAQITWAIAFQWDSVTGGSNGLVGVWPPELLSGKTAYYFATLLLVGGAILLIWRSVHAPLGYLLRASRDSRIRAEAVGVDVRIIQWRAIIVAGAAAGLAGALYVFSKGSLSPDSLSIPRSVDALAMVLIGGVQTLVGPVVGAVVFMTLQDWVVRATPYWHAVLGITLILITIIFPQGIVGTLRQWRQRREAEP
ncbi:MAG: branched-chain amino acid ABC transporter permease, partial [Hyphomicrobium sp.]|nr:branched-chain amino acid ABC transporter permease [Hyphomicrobium sp.]